jgi:hypothetical protein
MLKVIARRVWHRGRRGGATSGAWSRSRDARLSNVERRVLILVEDLPVPFDRRVWTESKALRDAGWKVTVISPKGEGAARWHERIDGIEVFRSPLPPTAAGFVNHLVE